MPSGPASTRRPGSAGKRGTNPRVFPAWLLTAFFLVAIPPAPAATLYLAPDGNDAWSGRRAEASADCGDGPVASLKGARDALRRLRAAGVRGEPVTVLVKPGLYRVAEAVTFLPEDSGSPDAPVTYEASERGRAVFTGGRVVTGWTRGDGALWKAEAPDARQGDWSFRQLFVNGQRRPRARLPEVGMYSLHAPAQIDASGWAGNPPPASERDRWSFQFKPGDIDKQWKNLSDVEIVVLQFWTEARLRIKAIDEKNHVAMFMGMSWRPLTWSGGYYVDNVYEGLRTPGSWHLDRARGVVYYHPLPGEDMSRVRVVAPAVEHLVRIEGDAASRRLVRDVIFRGLCFEHTTWSLPAAGFAYEQGELPAPSAVLVDGAVDCRIDRCDFAHLGGWGVEFRKGCRDCAVTRTTMRDLGAGCVKIGEPRNARDDAQETRSTIVSDNRFLGAGQVYLGSPAVWIGQSSRNLVSHNEISGPVMWAVSVGWTWSYFPLQRARDNVVEFNHCHDIGTGPLGAHCAIYALGTSPGTVIRNNYVHDVHSSSFWQGAGEGIILDNGCSGILVENNVVHDAVAGGFGTNFNCFGNIVLNNVFAYGNQYQLTVYGDAPTGAPQPKGEVFARNIVVWKEGPLIKEADWPSFRTLWDENLYWQDEGKPVSFMKYTFDQWKAKGLDVHSVVADPRFRDAAGRDFRLGPDSPAFRLGFRPIDLSTVGPRE
ncbi:MAG: right-handed parallel beta-helix repeat-containing protein [Isosphaeraceae bacterium]